MMAFYFAYGSNMNNNQMSRRCPRAVNLGHATLRGWTLRERLHADIDPHPRGVVHGVLWAVTPECEESLDRYEGVPIYYERDTVMVTTREGDDVEALVYIMSPESKVWRSPAPFTPSYADGCAVGAKENNAPVHRLFSHRRKSKPQKLTAIHRGVYRPATRMRVKVI